MMQCVTNITEMLQLSRLNQLLVQSPSARLAASYSRFYWWAMLDKLCHKVILNHIWDFLLTQCVWSAGCRQALQPDYKLVGVSAVCWRLLILTTSPRIQLHSSYLSRRVNIKAHKAVPSFVSWTERMVFLINNGFLSVEFASSVFWMDYLQK